DNPQWRASALLDQGHARGRRRFSGPRLEGAGMNDWLIRTPQGWVEPMPPACRCGSTRYMIGWTWCGCDGARNGGHRSWCCRVCEARTLPGCTRDRDALAGRLTDER